MKHFGKSLQTIFESIDGSQRKRYIYKQIRVPAPKGFFQRMVESPVSTVKQLLGMNTTTEEDEHDYEDDENMEDSS
jgi:hypothetical protein